MTMVVTAFRIVSDGCWSNISQWRFVQESIFMTQPNGFCCGKKRTLGYYLMTSDHRIVVSTVCENKKKLGFKVKVNVR